MNSKSKIRSSEIVIRSADSAPVFPELKSTLDGLCPNADLEAVARRLEELYFTERFTRFATKGGKSAAANPWCYYVLGRDQTGWCRNSTTGYSFSHRFDLVEHLTTRTYFGTCLNKQSGTRFAGLDFDNLADPEEMAILRNCIKKALEVGLTPHLVYSGNNLEQGNHLGVHLEFFFAKVVSIKATRRFLDWLTDGLHDKQGTCYPEALPTQGGRAYRLPFAVHKVTGNLALFVDPDSFALIEDQARYILGIVPDTFTPRYCGRGFARDPLTALDGPFFAPPQSCVTEFSNVTNFIVHNAAELWEWFQAGYCPRKESFSAIRELTWLCANEWQLTKVEAHQLLFAWNRKLPPLNHQTTLKGREREIEWRWRVAYAQGLSGKGVNSVLRNCWESDGRPRAEAQVQNAQLLLIQIEEEQPRPNKVRRAIADVLGVFFAAETCLSSGDGTFYLSQRTIQDVLGSGPNRVNRVMAYIVRRDRPWGASSPCEGHFYEQITYPSRRSRQAPVYRRLSAPMSG